MEVEVQRQLLSRMYLQMAYRPLKPRPTAQLNLHLTGVARPLIGKASAACYPMTYRCLRSHARSRPVLHVANTRLNV